MAKPALSAPPARSIGRITEIGAVLRKGRAPPGVAQGALLVGLVIAAWAPAWVGGAFIWDSGFFVRLHPAVTAGWPGLRALWTTFGADPSRFVVEPHYWPVLYTTFWIESALWGGWAPGYHATNVALHALNACLAWRLLARLRVPGAWWAAVVFALHPGQVEPVAWIIGRKDVLAGTFVLLAVAVWFRWTHSPPPPRLAGRLCLLILLLYVLGAWSKSSALVLPALLLILSWWTAGRVSLRDLRWLVPLAFAGTLLLLLELSVFGARAGLPEHSFLERTLIAARAFWVHWGIVLWPHPLPILYPRWPVSPTDPAAWAGLALIAAVCALLWRFRHRLGRGPLAAWLWFLVCLLPSLGLALHEYMFFSFVADRYRYLAILAPAALGAAAVSHAGVRLRARLTRHRRNRTPFGGQAPAALAKSKRSRTGNLLLIPVRLGLLLSLLVPCFLQSALYTRSLDYWTHVRTLRPDEIMGYDSVASSLLVEGRAREALEAADLAVARFPSHVRAYAVQVRARYAAGDWAGTLAAADRFLSLTTRCRAGPWRGYVAYMEAGCHSSDWIHTETMVHRALALWRLGHAGSATEAFRAARAGVHPRFWRALLKTFPALPPELSGDVAPGGP